MTGGADPDRRRRPEPLEGVLFDLDGTLVDTVGDIALALNRSLAEIGCSPVPDSAVRDRVGRGAPSLIARTLEASGVVTDAEGHDRLHDRFIAHYHALHHEGTTLARAYPGAREALEGLAAAGYRLGVVTNKHRSLAVCTLQAVGLAPLLDVIIGGDSSSRRKPHPDPLYTAARELGLEPSRALMIGDSLNDVAAARAAGMAVWCVPYGYNEGQDPRLLPCDGFIESLAELPGLLRQRRGASAPGDPLA